MSVYESIMKGLGEAVEYEKESIKSCTTAQITIQYLREELDAVEKDKLAGKNGCTVEELDKYLGDVIESAENGKA